MTHPNDPDWRKDLSPPPLAGRGFDENLRRRIEEQLDRKEARRRKRLWLWPAAVCGCAVLMGAGLWQTGALPWTPSGGQAAAAADSSALLAAGDPEALTVPAGPEVAAVALRSGVLIGLREDAAGGTAENSARDAAASRYRTLMVAPVDGRVQVAAEGSGILVPYGQKFWKIDSVVQATDTDLIQVLAAHPAEKAADPLPPVADNPKERVVHAEKLVFAGNQYLSVAEQDQVSTSRSNTITGRTWVRKLSQMPGAGSNGTSAASGSNAMPVPSGSGPSPSSSVANNAASRYVSILDIYGEGAASTLKELLGTFIVQDRKLQAATANKPLEDAPAIKMSDASFMNWTITRKPGRWTAQVAAPSTASDGGMPGYRLADYPTALPETVTAHDQVCCTWGQVRSLQPDAKDLLSSPLEDIMVVITDKEMSVYYAGSPSSGASTKPLLRVPLKPGEKLVSAQWATGSYVPAWVEKTRKLLEPQPAAEAAVGY
ncbi:hypothetical protein [Gorillibacterium sp. sgz5001074]|uniref:hypothetical protein n=1 Tax=Gorillibacterium sp. sgz5001074 TaxID=3446695 RepID=UPI003F67AC98